MNKKKSFGMTAALMGIIILISKVMGLFRDVLIAGNYGTTEAAIAYETASKLPVTVFDLVLGGVVTAAFIPVYNSLAVKEGKDKALEFAQSYLKFILLFTGLMTVLGVVFAPSLVSFMAPELNESASMLAVSLTRIMFPMMMFCGLAFSFVGYLQSEGEYNIPALISLVSNLIMVGYILILNDKFGITGLAFAMVIGWAAQALVQIPSVVKHGFRFSIKAKLNTEPLKRAAKNCLPILISTWISPVCNLINTRLASGIENGRAITALGYANRLYTIIVGVFSFVATNLLFPYFSRAAASGDRKGSDRLMKSSISVLTFIIAPIAVGVMVLSEQFTALIYENGSFNSSDTIITAEALRCYAVGMVFCAVNEVLTKAFFAEEKTKIPMISSVASMIFNVVIITLFSSKLGIGGIALVSGLAMLVSMTMNLISAYRRKMITITSDFVIDILKSIISAIIMGVAVYLSRINTGNLSLTISFIISVMCGVITYAVLCVILRFRTVKEITTKLLHRER